MQYCELALHLALEIFAHVTVQLIPPTLCIAHVICEGELVVQVQTEDMEVQGSLAALAHLQAEQQIYSHPMPLTHKHLD